MKTAALKFPKMHESVKNAVNSLFPSGALIAEKPAVQRILKTAVRHAGTPLQESKTAMDTRRRL